MRAIVLIACILSLGACSIPRGLAGKPIGPITGELNRKPDCTEVHVFKENPYIQDFTVCSEMNRLEDDQGG